MILLPIGDTRHVTYPCGHRHKHLVSVGVHLATCKTSRCKQQAWITLTPARRSDGWAELEVKAA